MKKEWYLIEVCVGGHVIKKEWVQWTYTTTTEEARKWRDNAREHYAKEDVRVVKVMQEVVEV